jgi:hypothetical protein
MPICLACMLGPTLTMRPVYAICARGSASRWFSSRAQYQAFKNQVETAVTQAQNSARKSTRPTSSLALVEPSSPTCNARKFLHKTWTFLPRAFGPGETLDFWDMCLSEYPNMCKRLQVVGEYLNAIIII